MRTRISWLALLLTSWGAVAGSVARGQDYGPPDPQFPLPLYSTRPDLGGFYAATEFLLWRETNPIKNQLVARRGLVDFDGSILADINGTSVVINTNNQVILRPGITTTGTFIGSGTPALFTGEVGGQDVVPGYEITLGWKFRNGLAIEGSWWGLFELKHAAVATLVPPDLQAGGPLMAETFLFSPVYAFPNDFAGNPNKLALGNPLAAYGIWNAASIMNLEWIQRFDQFDITGRIPLYQGEDCRCYGLVGPRWVWFWERFKWRTVSEDANGSATQDDVAYYNNITSNVLYGAHIGWGTEYRLGDTPIGTFAISGDVQLAAFLDVVKEKATYTRGDFETGSKRAFTDYAWVPEIQGQLNIWYYPIEGVELRLGFNAMQFFNTVSSPYPIDFNYGRVNPGWKDNTSRFLEGLNAGIGIIF